MKYIFLVDAGYLYRVLPDKSKRYDHQYIRSCLDRCCSEVDQDHTLLRILYYDCFPYQGTLTLPISKKERDYTLSKDWLYRLAETPKIALRLGELKFRGFQLKSPEEPHKTLEDQHFSPNFVQKGVDMKLGLDIATYSLQHIVDHIVLASSDTDCIPAMKLARRSGVQVSLIQFKTRYLRGKRNNLSSELLAHCDDVIPVHL